ncbi:hypothetical protein ACFE04_005991 [Oxalis oulophora]
MLEENISKRQQSSSSSPFVQCAELILPWLTHVELANISLTSKPLHQISSSITTQRSLDASRSFENLNSIPFINNTIDRHPYAYFIYTPSQTLPSSSISLRQPWGYLGSRRPSQLALDSPSLHTDTDTGMCIVVGCYCDKCEDEDEGCPCLCLGVVSECGPSCDCGLECGNRLTQRGISIMLKIVRHERKGWSLYAAQRIPDGQFVCEYAGELLTTEEARRRQKIYDELALGGKFSPALLVVREHLPSGEACLRINIDATRVGNVARFINHSCDGGNLLSKLVRSSGTLVPRLCFFASKEIQAGDELAFSYGEIRQRSKGIQCFCGSSCCVGSLPSENT